MWIALLAVFAAIVFVSAQRKRHPSAAWTASLYVLVAAALALAITFAMRNSRKPFADFDYALYEAEGFALGRAVAERFPGGGGVLVIRPVVNAEMIRKVMDARMRGIRQALPSSRYPVRTANEIAEDLIARDPTNPIADYISGDRLADVLREFPKTRAIISFAGLPRPTRALQKVDLPPLFLGVWTDEMSVAAWMRGGRVAAYVRTRRGTDPDAKPTSDMSLAEIFALRYELVSAPGR